MRCNLTKLSQQGFPAQRWRTPACVTHQNSAKPWVFECASFVKVISKQCGELIFRVGTLAALEYANAFFTGRTPHGSSTAGFTKMQGIGNDYVYVNGFEEQVSDPGALARGISDRHFGVGSDGLVLILPSTVAGADARMRMFNADGSESEMCGNAVRCVGKYVHDAGICARDTVRIETLAGSRRCACALPGNGEVDGAVVDMGGTGTGCRHVSRCNWLLALMPDRSLRVRLKGRWLAGQSDGGVDG